MPPKEQKTDPTGRGLGPQGPLSPESSLSTERSLLSFLTMSAAMRSLRNTVVFPRCQNSTQNGRTRVGPRLMSTSTSLVFLINNMGARIRTGAHARRAELWVFPWMVGVRGHVCEGSEGYTLAGDIDVWKLLNPRLHTSPGKCLISELCPQATFFILRQSLTKLSGMALNLFCSPGKSDLVIFLPWPPEQLGLQARGAGSGLLNAQIWQ